MRSDRTLPFREHFDEFEMQPLLVSRAKYQRAVEMALEWQRSQDGAVEKLNDIQLHEARAKEVEKLHQKIGNLSDTPNVSCGTCIICQSRKSDSDVTPSSKRHTLRASTRQRRACPLKGVRAGQELSSTTGKSFSIHTLTFIILLLLADTSSGEERVCQCPTCPAARESSGSARRNILAR